MKSWFGVSPLRLEPVSKTVRSLGGISGFLVLSFLSVCLWSFLGSSWLAEARFGKDQEPPSKPIEFHPPETQRIELPNGMVLHLLEDHELPLVEMIALIRTGSVYEPAEKAGLADLTGDLMRTGGTTSMTGDQIDETLEFIAGSVTTSINKEMGTASLSVLSKDLDTGLDIFSGILRHPVFDPGKLAIHANEMIEAIRRQNDDPQDLAERELIRRIYPDNPYGRFPTLQTVQAVTREDCVRFHETYFHPNNIILGIAGDFQVDDMVKRIEKAFGDWPAQKTDYPAIPTPNTDPASFAGGTYLVEKSIPQTVVRMGHLGIRRSDPDFYPVQVMNFILGGNGFTSRLMREIRSDRGLAYSVWSYFSMGYGMPGFFEAGLETKGETTHLSLNLMRDIIDSMKKGLVGQEELDLAKEAIIHSFVFSFDSSLEVVKHRSTIEFFGLPKDTLEVYRDKIAQVTREDVQRVSQKYLHSDKAVILVVGDQARFDDPIADWGKVEVVVPQ